MSAQDKWSGVFISDERVGGTPSIILARSGRIISDRDTMTLDLRLENGTIHRRPRQQETGYQIVGFNAYDVNLNMGQQFAAQEKRPRKASEISTADLFRQRKDAVSEELRKITAELHQRFILPLSPLLFALIGVPLGIQAQRSGRGGGFAVGLAVFLAYYLLLSFAETLAVEGGWPAPILWLPSLLFLVGSLILLVRAAKEKRITSFISLLERIPRPFRRRPEGVR